MRPVMQARRAYSCFVNAEFTGNTYSCSAAYGPDQCEICTVKGSGAVPNDGGLDWHYSIRPFKWLSRAGAWAVSGYYILGGDPMGATSRQGGDLVTI